METRNAPRGRRARGVTRGFAAVAAAGLALSAASCVEPPPPDTTTTTTIAQLGPAAGCYDSFVDTIDLTYSGTPNVLGNLTPHTTGDGTCQGLNSHPYYYTLVIATPEATVQEFCADNGMERPQEMDARSPTYDWRLNGVTIGPDAYVCLKHT